MSIATLIEPGVGSFGNIATFITDGLSPYTGLPLPPMTGLQYQDCTTTTPSGSPPGPLTLETGNGVSVGDVFIAQLITAPGSYSIVLNDDGTVDILSGGDISRQSFLYDIFYHSTNTLLGTGTVWINELPALWNGAINFGQFAGLPLAPISLTEFASSPEGDTLTFALASGSLPPGITLNYGVISGTFGTSSGTYQFTFSATDITGMLTTSPQNQLIVIGNAPVWTQAVNISLQAATAMTPINLASYVYSPGGDPLSITLYSGSLPPGINLVGTTLSGTLSTTIADYSFTFLATDTVTTLKAVSANSSINVTYQPVPTAAPVYSPLQRVTSRQFSWTEMAIRAWGSEFAAPDHRIYEFSNGRGFDSTDMLDTGIYRPPESETGP